MIAPAWFEAAVAAGLAAIAWRWRRRGLRPGGAEGPLPLFDLAALGASLCGGGLGGLTAGRCFGVYPAEMLLGSAFCGAVVLALATAYLLW